MFLIYIQIIQHVLPILVIFDLKKKLLRMHLLMNLLITLT